MRWLRILCYIALFFLGAVHAEAQSNLDAPISALECKGNLSKCLDLLTNQTNVSFNYKNDVIEKSKFQIKVQNTTLRAVLDEVREKCDIDYAYSNAIGITLVQRPKFYVLGSLVHATSSERLSGVSITYTSQRLPLESDKNGLFSIYTTQDELEIIAYHPLFQLVKVVIKPSENKFIYIKLTPIVALNEIEVNQLDSIKLPFKSFDELSPSQKIVPTVGGETDAFNNIKLLPGVSNVSFGNRGLIVRGGGPDQSSALIDGVPVYKTFHLLGLFSVLNSSSINNIKVHKDGLPLKYSNRLSSVIDVGLNNGNKQKTSAEADIGILSSGFSINGPILKDKLSYALTARRTYFDLLSLPIQRLVDRNSDLKSTNRLWCFDIFGKIHFQPNYKNQFSLMSYNGGDQLNFETRFLVDNEKQTDEQTKSGLGWRNNLVGFQWHYMANSRIQTNLEVSRSTYNLNFLDRYSLYQKELELVNELSYSNGLSDDRITMDVDIILNKNNMLQVGTGFIRYTFEPFKQNYNTKNLISSFDTLLTTQGVTATESMVFAENKTYFKGGNVVYGMGIRYFNSDTFNYIRLQPKFILTQNINRYNQLKFGFSVVNQFIHQAPNNNLGLPIDIWLPISAQFKPMNVTQLSSKYVLKKTSFESSAGVFNKYYTNMLEFANGGPLKGEGDLTKNLVSGIGRAYGLELASKYSKSDYSIYAAYTYCRSLLTVAGINDNLAYFSRYDRPNEVNILAEHKLNAKDKLIVSFSYASGNPITIPSSRYMALVNGEQVIIEEFEKINNFRLPSTHHVDISYVHTKSYAKFRSTLILGIYNIYNQHNPFMVYLGVNKNDEPSLKSRSYLPVMPMFKYTLSL